MTNKTVYTIADIARLANVSKSTVSRALNDSPLIKDETKDRIREIAKECHFQVNVPARQLSLKQSNTVAYVTYHYHQYFPVAELFGMEVMGGISHELYANGYDMLVIHVNPHDTDWIRKYLDTGRVDGFVMITSTQKRYHIKALVEAGAPFITWGNASPKYHYSTVAGDDFHGGQLAGEYLIHSGRQRIAYIGGPADELEVQQRFEGYRSALESAGREIVPARIAYGDYMVSSGAVAMRKLLEQAPDLDAVFVNSDLMATAAIDVLQESGRRVPDDVAVVGYDDLSIAEFYRPALTTIRQNAPLAGTLLARNLIQYLKTGVVTNVTIPVELVIRKSA